jgi:RNA polymerase sigma-70 factor (ECF subfamily)
MAVIRVEEGVQMGLVPSPRDDFDAFYLREFPRLTALGAALAGAPAADDIAQEAMLVAYRRWRHVRELDRPELWVRRICSNMAVSTFRRRMVELRVLSQLVTRSAPAVELGDTGRELWEAIAALPTRQRQVAALRFVYDMPLADIAEILGLTEGTVKVHLHRARTAVAVRLGLTSTETDGVWQ